MDVIVALMFDKRLGTARFQNVKHKASSNAFQYIGLTPSAFASRVKTGAKIRNISETQKKKAGNF
jgi:hypothetical protein